jgi:multiple sugar transport system ATP-binding protein
MPKVVLTNVSKIYSGRMHSITALSGASIKIQDREFVVLSGPAGCGKSTLLRVIAGLEVVSSGDIQIGDRRVNDLPPKSRDVAMVFTDDALYPNMTAFDNIAFGLERRRFAKAKIKKHVTDAAGVLAIESLLEQKPESLSVEQRQRVAIARAIARQPKVLLFDEPFTRLHPSNRAGLRKEITQLHHRLQATIIYATADSIEAMSVADRIVILNNGMVQQADAPLSLYHQPANVFVAGFLGRPPMNLLRGELRQVRDTVRFFEADDGTVEVPVPMLDQAVARELIDKPVLLGIRPEDIELAEYANWREDSAVVFAAIAEQVEARGGETILYLQTGPHRLICRSRHALERCEAGRRIQLKLNITKVCFFDAISAKRIV